jgi:alpha-ketoglutarate-dependent sulfate ester dioxygenase
MGARGGTSAVETKLDIRPLSRRIGVEIHGVRLSGQLSGPTIRLIRQAILEHKVVFFRGQNHLGDAGQEAFAKRLGTVVPRSTAQFSILRGSVISPLGSDEVWTNTTAVYQGSSAALREQTDRLWVFCASDYEYTGARPGGTERARPCHREVILSAVEETEHPVVQIHPETDEPAPIAGHHVRQTLGCGSVSSTALSLLRRHIARLENTVRWRWSIGDIAIWDNVATQHRPIDDHDTHEHRVRRVTVAGGVPCGTHRRQNLVLGEARPAEQPANVRTETVTGQMPIRPYLRYLRC